MLCGEGKGESGGTRTPVSDVQVQNYLSLLSLLLTTNFSLHLFSTKKNQYHLHLHLLALTSLPPKTKKKKPSSQVSPEKSPHLPLKYHHLLQVAEALSLSLSPIKPPPSPGKSKKQVHIYLSKHHKSSSPVFLSLKELPIIFPDELHIISPTPPLLSVFTLYTQRSTFSCATVDSGGCWTAGVISSVG